ncbi:MAG: hypothetical protein AAGC85_04715 [Bacteroidota bacterium]
MNQKLLLALLLFCVCSAGGKMIAQDLLTSRKASEHGYIYQITNAEAKLIYKKEFQEIGESSFHSPIDTFLVDSGYHETLPPGHYLKIYAKGNQQKLEILSVPNVGVHIANNGKDLLIKLLSAEGEIVSDAEVRVKGKKLPFDQLVQAFRHRKSNKRGLLEVRYKKYSHFVKLNRQYNNSAFKRTYRQIVYRTPFAYVWRPVDYLIHLPIDGVKSISRGYRLGTIAKTVRFADRTFSNLQCWFNPYYCSNFYKEFGGYLITNKPKYLPGDTVKVKAFILGKRDKPFKKDLQLFVDNKQLFEVSSVRPGCYVAEFTIEDSLNVKLDQRFMVKFAKESRRKERSLSTSVKYEEYELDDVSLIVSTDKQNHYRDSSLTLTIKAEDSNGLQVREGSIRMIIKSSEVGDVFEEAIFLTDTLLDIREILSSKGSTDIIIPDTIFPNANLTYDIEVVLLTSDNQRLEQQKRISFFHLHREANLRLLGDSLKASLLENGTEKSVPATLYGFDSFGNEILLQEGIIPFSYPIDPFFLSYKVEVDSTSAFLTIHKEASLLQFFSDRKEDSLFISAQNPRNIPFSFIKRIMI